MPYLQYYFLGYWVYPNDSCHYSDIHTQGTLCTAAIDNTMSTLAPNSRLTEAPSLESLPERQAETRVGHLASTGFGLGGLVGAAIGAAALGIAAMVTDLVLPGSGTAVTSPLSALILGAGAGAANGGLAGALIGWGIPVERSAAEPASSHSLLHGLRAAFCTNACTQGK